MAMMTLNQAKAWNTDMVKVFLKAARNERDALKETLAKLDAEEQREQRNVKQHHTPAYFLDKRTEARTKARREVDASLAALQEQMEAIKGQWAAMQEPEAKLAGARFAPAAIPPPPPLEPSNADLDYYKKNRQESEKERLRENRENELLEQTTRTNWLLQLPNYTEAELVAAVQGAREDENRAMLDMLRREINHRGPKAGDHAKAAIAAALRTIPPPKDFEALQTELAAIVENVALLEEVAMEVRTGKEERTLELNARRTELQREYGEAEGRQRFKEERSRYWNDRQRARQSRPLVVDITSKETAETAPAPSAGNAA